MIETPESKVTKRPGKGKQVGKPWPGPPLSGTSNMDNVHLKINLRNAPKPKSRSTRPRRSEGEGIQNEEVVEEQTDAIEIQPKPERKPSLMADVLVITVLWTMDIIHIVIDTFKGRYFSDVFTYAEAETIERVTEEKFILIYSLVPMLAVGTCLTFSLDLPILEFLQESKFWVMLIGLSIYGFSAVVGIILAASRNTAVGIFLAWQEIMWYAVHPIRFWYIFHQRFPISVRRSHLFVSGNILAIGVTELIVKVLVKNAKHPFSRLFYGVSYSIVAVVAVGWLIGIYFLQRFLNSANGDFSSVREVYAKTEVIENFDRRQKSSSILLFLALIYPAAIFSVTSVYIEFGHIKLLENALTEDMGVSSCRPDLISALLVIMIVEVVLQFFRPIRNEFTDLVFIVVAHLINIIAVIMIMQILYLTKDTRYKYPEKDEANLVVSSDEQDRFFLQVGDDINKFHKGNSHVIIKNIPDDGILPIRFVQPKTGKVIFSDYLDIQMSRNLSASGYNFVKWYGKDYQLLKISPFPHTQYINENKARVFFSNGLEECNDYYEPAYNECKFDPNTIRGGRVLGMCLPLSIMWLQAGNDGEKVIPFKPPAYNEVIMLEVPCETKTTDSDSAGACLTPPMKSYFYKLGFYLKLRKEVGSTVYGEISPYETFMIRIGADGDVYGPKFTIHNLIKYRPEREKILVITMSVYGLSLGLAWVGYIHFIWIQCPVKCRMLIIYSFFALIFTISALTERNLLKFNENSVFFLLVFVILCFLWQVGTTVLFIIRTTSSRREEQPQHAWRRY